MNGYERTPLLSTFAMLLVLAFLFLSAFRLGGKEYEVFGPEGGIALKICLPEDFDPDHETCPMVILMHGIFSSKDYNPMPALAKGLAETGISSIRFDFDGHGRSEGRLQDMTIEKEIQDAIAVWKYVSSLPYVKDIGFLGHSQGGVIASMTAGRIAERGETAPLAMALLAPGSVIKEACQGGRFFNARFDPKDPPRFIRCWGVKKLGRSYLVETQSLDIYGTAAHYDGPVLIVHGDKDRIVPLWCSEKFHETYGDISRLSIVEGENHTINRRREVVVKECVDFFMGVFGLDP